MNDSITIVTAFFPLGRSGWKKYGCSDEKYLDNFSFWARIHNKIVVYTTPELKDRVMEIRRGFGRADSTTVIGVEDFRSLDAPLFSALKEAADNRLARIFHRVQSCPEVWNAEYDYVMMLKPMLVNDAVKRGLVSDNAVWLDFGYNHGGVYYLKSEEFDFEWRYDFGDRINIFALRSLDDGVPIFEVVRNMNAYVAGGLIAGRAALWPAFGALFRENALALTRVGLVDDDQTALLMSFRQRPDIFTVHESSWFNPLELCCSRKFTVDASTLRQSPGPFRRLKLFFRNRRRSLAHVCRIFNAVKTVEYD